MKTDAAIQRDLIEELKWDPFLIASEIGVAVHNGAVTLSGFVDTYAKKFAAEHAARRVKGVKTITEELEVHLLEDGKLPDAEIAENIVNALKWNNSLPDEVIKIAVADGWVTLSGEVNWKFEKDLAHHAIRYLKGIKGDRNEITIKPGVSRVVVKDHIYEALERNAHFEAETIKVETIGNTVILKGTIRSWNERQAVERAAWSTPGVSVVQDDLVMIYS